MPFSTEVNNNLSHNRRDYLAMINMDIRAVLVGYGYGKDAAKRVADRALEAIEDRQ